MQFKQAALEPRKTPMQARSEATVEAILEATIQVLVSAGKGRLTTTRVASRAGVSVGTLYQYFPNKSALLQAVLQRHLDRITTLIEQVCLEQRGRSLKLMGTALMTTFLAAKMQQPKTSVALYSVSSDVDGAKISQKLAVRSTRAIAGMLASASTPLARDPQLVATVLQATMNGVSRRLLESAAPEKRSAFLRDELVFLTSAYLQACAKR